MKLNCKVGDLAVVINAHYVKSKVGRLVRCIELVQPGFLFVCTVSGDTQVGDFQPTWIVESGNDRWLHGDARLRPIRDPGDDAVDESLSWLPVPFPELERA